MRRKLEIDQRPKTGIRHELETKLEVAPTYLSIVRRHASFVSFFVAVMV